VHSSRPATCTAADQQRAQQQANSVHSSRPCHGVLAGQTARARRPASSGLARTAAQQHAALRTHAITITASITDTVIIIIIMGHCHHDTTPIRTVHACTRAGKWREHHRPRSSP